MKTVGIDLAAQDKNTATCVVDWSTPGRLKVEEPTIGHDDDGLLDLICSSDRAGIDAPFGWPEAFADAVAAHQARKRWPGAVKDLRELAEARAGFRKSLNYRVTDLAIMANPDLKVRPLSVSTDRIGVTAFRCALLLERLSSERGHKVDRSGRHGCVAEVYPAAALNSWDLPHSGYKRKIGRPTREELVATLGKQLGEQGFAPPARRACEASDHALDALISALVARAVAIGKTTDPGPGKVTSARLEGWIHIPNVEPRALC